MDAEALGVLDLWLQRAGPQKSEGARFGQELEQHRKPGVGEWPPSVGAGHRRRVSPQAR